MSGFDDINKELDRIGIACTLPVVHAILVQDHSGSMTNRCDVAMDNVNEQLSKMKRESDEVETTVTIIEFDDRIIVKDTLTIGEMDELTDWWCDGLTSLRDAIGKSMVIGKELLDKYDSDDQSVLVIVFTDGEENSSKEWSDVAIREQMCQLETTDKWTFTFMGGELQKREAVKMGFSVDNIGSTSFDKKSLHSSNLNTLSGLNKYYNIRKTGSTSMSNFYEDKGDEKWQQNTEEST